MIFRYGKKRTIDKIVERNHWRGFQDGISDGLHCSLEYTSTSGWYQYNPAKQVAYDAGYAAGQKILKDHDSRLNGDTHYRFRLGFRYDVPGSVYREAYDAQHFVWKGDAGTR